SVVQSVGWIDDAVVLTLSPANIHRSAGHPAKDSGTVCRGCATIRIEGARRTVVDFPTPIWDGTLTLGRETHEGCIPSRGTYKSAVRLQIEFLNGHSIYIQGRQITIQQVGEPTYLEEFRP